MYVHVCKKEKGGGGENIHEGGCDTLPDLNTIYALHHINSETRVEKNDNCLRRRTTTQQTDQLACLGIAHNWQFKLRKLNAD